MAFDGDAAFGIEDQERDHAAMEIGQSDFRERADYLVPLLVTHLGDETQRSATDLPGKNICVRVGLGGCSTGGWSRPGAAIR